MNRKDAKRVLKHSNRLIALTALSFVNLTDRELDLLVLRYLRGMTQEEAAEETGYSSNGIQKQEYAALDKCCEAWDDLAFIKHILKAAN